MFTDLLLMPILPVALPSVSVALKSIVSALIAIFPSLVRAVSFCSPFSTSLSTASIVMFFERMSTSPSTGYLPLVKAPLSSYSNPVGLTVERFKVLAKILTLPSFLSDWSASQAPTETVLPIMLMPDPSLSRRLPSPSAETRLIFSPTIDTLEPVVSFLKPAPVFTLPLASFSAVNWRHTSASDETVSIQLSVALDSACE